MKRRKVVKRLLELGIESRTALQTPPLAADALGVVLYGSRARGDAVEGSDLDLLILSETAHPGITAGDVSVSYYTTAQLQSGIGTLFGAHLRRDAVIVLDPTRELSILLANMGDVHPDRLFERARVMSALFTSRDIDLPTYLPGLLRHARYLLRSCLYAQTFAHGNPCFSVREIAQRQNDDQLVKLLASRQSEEPSDEDLTECLERLEQLIGPFPDNANGSLEATIVNEWGKPSDLLSAAFMALGTTGEGSVYAEVEKILL